MTKAEINNYFEYFINSDPSCDGLERFLSPNGADEVFERLKNSESLDINKVQLNQLFIISGLTSITYGFFKYYWLTLPESNHPYNLRELEIGYAVKNEGGDESLTITGGYQKDNIENYFFETTKESPSIPKALSTINTIEHFRWGLLRIYTDALLFFGNITHGFNQLNMMKYEELVSFFDKLRFNTKLIKARGHSLVFNTIEKDDRFLISEAVCKNLDADDATKTALRKKLIERYREAVRIGKTNVKVFVLLDKEANIKKFKDIPNVKVAKQQLEVQFTMEDEVSTTEFFETVISSEAQIDEIIVPLYQRFVAARNAALQNTKLYLSLLNDMDVYVATSMRSKGDFVTMADNCYKIFHDPSIKEFQLRYFDPTISAAEGHDDKGLIECLMVQCAKLLIYTSGDKDSYGKDAEAAMALSSGKPVIFYCPDEIRYNVSKNIHPLTKLIDFNTGVANGAMVARNLPEVRTLILRWVKNEMQYMLTCEKVIIEGKTSPDKIEKSYFKLKDTQTASTVRVQTSDLFLAKSFWNYFDRHVKTKMM